MSVIPIINGSYKSESRDNNYQQCVNMYPIAGGPGARAQTFLSPTAGCVEITDLSATEARGIVEVDGNIYVVVDNKVYKLVVNVEGVSAVSTLLGTIQTSTGFVRFARNPTQLIIVDSSAYGYVVTLSTGVITQIDSSDNFFGGSHVVFCDGYFMYNQPGTALLRTSALNDGTTWDVLDVATAESRPDALVGLATNKGEVWAFGTDTIEVWYDAANANGLPFSRRDGSNFDVGCAAGATIVEVNNYIIWLDSRGYVVRSQISAYIRDNSSGYSLEVLGSDALHAEIATYGDLSNASATTYSDRGHTMYQITFPDVMKTWVYDTTTQAWHERNTFSSYYGFGIQHLVQYCTTLQGKSIGCGTSSGKIYLMSSDYFDDNGIPIRRIYASSPIAQENKLITINRLELRLGIEHIPVTGDGSDPQITMRYSNDGSHTWSHHLYRDIGPTGAYGEPITWNRLGSAREWVFEFSIVEPIDFSVIEGSIIVDIEE